MASPAPRPRLHLRGVAWASLAAAAGIAIACLWAHHLERRYIHALAPRMFDLKNQGVALQAEAFRQPDLLPLYGSSELVKDIPDSAAHFFKLYPTGFTVFPVGKAGASPLIMLQKLAAVGSELRGKKVVISISPTWFFNRSIKPFYYAGNYSSLQAGEFIFSDQISPALKHDAARSMLAFPDTLKKTPVLASAVSHLARHSWRDRTLYRLLRPLGLVEIAYLRIADHLETLRYITHEHATAGLAAFTHRVPRTLDWPQLTARATRDAFPEQNLRAMRKGGDQNFLATLDRAKEWKSLELLLRGLREMGADTLLLTMPVNGTYFDEIGVTAAARGTYYEKLHALAARYQQPLIDFREYEDDPKFLVDTKDHLSVEGWMFYNQALDAFYHGHWPVPKDT